MGYGRYFEEFEIGEIIRHWPGKTITESDNNLFCLLTMNHHPVHIDAHYAAEQQHGRILVVGTCVFSIAVGLTVRDISGAAIANLEYEYVRHLNPVFIGDTIYAETRVIDKHLSKSKPDRGIVYVETNVKNHRGEGVLQFRRRILIPRQ